VNTMWVLYNNSKFLIPQQSKMLVSLNYLSWPKQGCKRSIVVKSLTLKKSCCAVFPTNRDNGKMTKTSKVAPPKHHVLLGINTMELQKTHKWLPQRITSRHKISKFPVQFGMRENINKTMGTTGVPVKLLVSLTLVEISRSVHT